MIDARNNGNLIGGLVADPELVGNNNDIVRLRIASDFSGRDANNPDNKTGYFRVTMFLNDDNPNTRFVKGQIEKGNLKKGSQVHILYRLQQDRWDKDGKTMSDVTLVAESLNYAGSAPKSMEAGEPTAAAGNIPDEF